MRNRATFVEVWDRFFRFSFVIVSLSYQRTFSKCQRITKLPLNNWNFPSDGLTNFFVINETVIFKKLIYWFDLSLTFFIRCLV